MHEGIHVQYKGYARGVINYERMASQLKWFSRGLRVRNFLLKIKETTFLLLQIKKYTYLPMLLGEYLSRELSDRQVETWILS